MILNERSIITNRSTSYFAIFLPLETETFQPQTFELTKQKEIEPLLSSDNKRINFDRFMHRINRNDDTMKIVNGKIKNSMLNAQLTLKWYRWEHLLQFYIQNELCVEPFVWRWTPQDANMWNWPSMCAISLSYCPFSFSISLSLSLQSINFLFAIQLYFIQEQKRKVLSAYKSMLFIHSEGV